MLVCNECRRSAVSSIAFPQSPPPSPQSSPSLSPTFVDTTANEQRGLLEHRHPSPTYPDMFGMEYKSPTSAAMQPQDFLHSEFKLPDNAVPGIGSDIRGWVYSDTSLSRPQTLLLKNSMAMHTAQLRQRPLLDASAAVSKETAGSAASSGSKLQKDGQHKLLVPAVLSLLVMQNAGQMLSMRYSKVMGIPDGSIAYISSTAVVVSELLKVSACLVILAVQHGRSFVSRVYSDVVVNWRDTLLVSVPAFVYMVQNNLLYLAAANLDAATCQLTYQLKILTTALFAVGMLGKQISNLKWASLFILLAGVILVQTPAVSIAGKQSSLGNPAVGLSAVMSACLMSGFAGIYFEKVSARARVWRNLPQSCACASALSLSHVCARTHRCSSTPKLASGPGMCKWGRSVRSSR